MAETNKRAWEVQENYVEKAVAFTELKVELRIYRDL